MFDLWKLKYERRKTAKLYDREIRKRKKEKQPQDEFAHLYAEEAHEVGVIDDAINAVISDRLFDEARNFDVEIPPIEDGEFWKKDWYHQRYFLSAKGRSTIRKLIDDEKARRFEVKVRWAKLALPVITALAGLIGVITGLVAILRK